MTDDKDSKGTVVDDPTRRNFIKTTSRVAGSSVGGVLLGGVFVSQAAQAKPNEPEAPNFQEARQFFTRASDFEVLKAATERLFPEDDNGPGAIGLNVPYFIDKQLAGLWGINGQDYRAGPFQPQTEEDLEHGEPYPEQSAMNRGAIFLNGLRKLNEVSEKRFGKRFENASEEQQIQILQAFENDDIDMVGVAASDFFTLLRQTTLEGAYSDPLYGGNKNLFTIF